MVSDETNSSRRRRNPKPLDQTALRDLALSYVARFSTSAAKLESYLIRKIRERGVADDMQELDPRAIVERLVELKYIDDEAYARERSSSLLRRGYGARRVEETLRHSGISEAVRSDIAPDEWHRREAAIRLARKRRFGPFGDMPEDSMPEDSMPEDRMRDERAKREKQIAAMVRAGHGFAAARFLVEARSEEDVEQWLAEARGE